MNRERSSVNLFLASIKVFCSGIADWVESDHRLSPSCMRVLMHLMRRGGYRKPFCFPGESSIASSLHLSIDSVQRAIRWLKENNYIALWKKHNAAEHETAWYFINYFRGVDDDYINSHRKTASFDEINARETAEFMLRFTAMLNGQVQFCKDLMYEFKDKVLNKIRGAKLEVKKGDLERLLEPLKERSPGSASGTLPAERPENRGGLPAKRPDETLSYAGSEPSRRSLNSQGEKFKKEIHNEFNLSFSEPEPDLEHSGPIRSAHAGSDRPSSDVPGEALSPVLSHLETAQDEEAGRVYSLAMASLQGRLSVFVYNGWLDPLVPIAMTSSGLYLEAPNKFHCDWVRDHYTELLQEVTGMPIHVTCARRVAAAA